VLIVECRSFSHITWGDLNFGVLVMVVSFAENIVSSQIVRAEKSLTINKNLRIQAKLGTSSVITIG